ncbi:MAG: NAD-dependent epimerase/dehydratase family protein, partial [Micrococcales bacterium]|nr:NAD-dependent epimerase/dehydratase family protein [Micrococcales bacterium]
EVIVADVDSDRSMAKALGRREFDVVADFLSYLPFRLLRNIDLLKNRVGQFIFISSASAYQKPVATWPITESTPLDNPFWLYSRDKIDCEEAVMGLVRESGFPATIVRPSHTYDAGSLVTVGGWTDVVRMRQGRPVIVPGDGTSLWTLTHSADFANWFTALLGESRALGEAFHITGDEILTWDGIYRELAAAAGVSSPNLVHVASETMEREIFELDGDLLGDKSHSVFFDNSKVRAFAPDVTQQITWATGARQIVDFRDAHPEYAEADDDEYWNDAFDRLAARA